MLIINHDNIDINNMQMSHLTHFQTEGYYKSVTYSPVSTLDLWK